MVAPILHEIEGEYAGRLTLYEIDVDANEKLCEMFGIYEIPEIMLIHEGELVSTYVGNLSKSSVRDWVQTHMALIEPVSNDAEDAGSESTDEAEEAASEADDTGSQVTEAA
jgi:thioredoxin-like negative regulator of GroEL